MKKHFLPLLASIAFGACAADRVESRGPVVRDSAGIRIVESNTPVWNGTDRWHLTPEPILHLGDETKPAEQFVRIVNAFRLRGGTVVVINSNNPPDLRFFSETGAHLTTVGGPGGGPGEFRSIAAAYYVPPDTLLVHDPGAGRNTFISTTGEFLGSVNVDLSTERSRIGFVTLYGRFNDGTLLARPNALMPRDPPYGTGRTSTTWWRVRYDGSFVDSLVRYPDIDYYRPGGQTASRVTFGRRTLAVADGENLYIGTGEEGYEIRIHDQTGRLHTILRRAYDPRPVTDEMVATLKQEGLDAAQSPESRTRIERWWADRQLPAILPPHGRRLLRDAADNLWIEEYQARGDVPAWSVFDAEGRWLGIVDMPDGFRPLDIGRDYVLGVRRDDLDVEHVQVYDLIKPGQ